MALLGDEYWKWLLEQPELVRQQELEAERWRARDESERQSYRRLVEDDLRKLRHEQLGRFYKSADLDTDLHPDRYRRRFRYQPQIVDKEHDLWALDNSREQALLLREKLGRFSTHVDALKGTEEQAAFEKQAACEEDALLERLALHFIPEAIEASREAEREAAREVEREAERKAEYARQLERERPHQYETLTSPSHFRLLELHPDCPADSTLQSFLRRHQAHLSNDSNINSSPEQDLLVCSLETFSLDSPECPMYEALSYEWSANGRNGNEHSEPDARGHIVIRKGSAVAGLIEVGSNLLQFLRRLRRYGHRWIWADATCINQNSSQEKGHQIRLMGRIYTQAEKVLAWLSAHDLYFDNDSIDDSYPGSLQDLFSISTADRLSELSALYATGVGFVYPQRRSLTNSARRALMEVLRQPFWERKWIIQEILLARTVVLIMGETEVPMKGVEDFLARLEEAHTTQPSTKDHIPVVRTWPVARLAMHRRNRRLGKPYPQRLCDLLPLYRSSKCSVPVDHVYALYNLVGDHRKHFQIDYEQPPGTWLRRVLLFLDEHEATFKNTAIDVANILQRLVAQSDGLDMHTAPTDPHITATAFDRGKVECQEECFNSTYLRRKVQDLDPGIQWTLEESQMQWCRKETDDPRPQPAVNVHVLPYFEIPGQNLCGMAAVRLREGDHLWQFLNAPLGLIVRAQQQSETTTGSGPEMRIVSRCYLFDSRASEQGQDPEQKVPPPAVLAPEAAEARQEELQRHDLRLTIPDLLTLARSVGDGGVETAG